MGLPDVLAEARKHRTIHLQELGKVYEDDLRVIDFSHDVSSSLNPTDLLLFNSSTGALINVANPKVTWHDQNQSATFATDGLDPGTYNVVVIGDGIVDGARIAKVGSHARLGEIATHGCLRGGERDSLAAARDVA